MKLPPRRAWLIDFAVWTGFALLYGGRMVALLGQAQALQSMIQWLECCWVWALLTFPVMRLAARFPLGGGQATTGRILLHVGCALGVSAVALVPDALTWRLLNPATPDSLLGIYLDTGRGYLHWNLLNYAGVVLVWHALDWRERLGASQVREAELRAGLRQAELDALRMQLNPHFLFNTLNTIDVLLAEDPPAARQVLADLCAMLRVVLHPAPGQAWPLRDEIALIRRYLAIEQARFGARLAPRVEVQEHLLDLPVPTLLLQPLVENAVRHGAGRRLSAGEVRVTASLHAPHLILRVEDNGPGLVDGRIGGGIGLANTRARLRHLQGPGEHLRLLPAEGGGLRAEVLVRVSPLSAPASPAPAVPLPA